MNRSDFVHLHIHTEYSLLDSACRIDRLFEHIKNLGQTAAAITDHGNMYGAVEFYKKAKENGIKPVIGCEAYVAVRGRNYKEPLKDSVPFHIILLCKNDIGYKNLIKLVSLSGMEGFYIKPRIDMELIEKYHEGLICLSGCISGEVSQKLLNNNYEGAKAAAEKYHKIFGEDYYIEIQNHGTPDELRILNQLYRLSYETGIPLCASNDCHYIYKSESEIQKLLYGFQKGNPTGKNLQNSEYYIKSTEDMYALFKGHEEAVLNTSEIAEKCNFDFKFGNVKLPRFKRAGINDNKIFLENLCRQGMKKRYGNPSPEVVKRLEYELSVINGMNYTDYYLIVWDFVKYAKTHDIPVGPGRGSGAGSLCAYCIGITNIDPIKYNLIFERFLNAERVNLPDFDIDFCIEGRNKVKEYVTRIYGEERVAGIAAFDTFKAKLSVREVGRTEGISSQIIDKISKLIGDCNTLDEALRSSPELSEIYRKDNIVKNLIDKARSIEGFPRHLATHAAGIIISAENLDELVPLHKNNGSIETQYTMTELERLGLLKFDFLGLRTLTVIKYTVNQIKKRIPDFDISKIPLDDEEVYKMLSDGDLDGVFQLESTGIKNLTINIRPRNIEDIITILSLYRPGPMESIPKYLENVRNPEKITYKHPMLEDILKNTYGCILYQEQVMEICRKLAGFSYGHADMVRSAMSKKKHDVMMKEKKSFIEGAVKNGIPVYTAESIFDDMSGFAQYAFNRSHGAAYAHIVYQTAYLKCHYFKEYMSSLMTSVISNTAKLTEYISKCHSKGINIIKPDINLSSAGFIVSGENIIFGLTSINNVGNLMAENIAAEREANGRYTSFQDFCQRNSGKNLNKLAVANMIKAGVFDGLGFNRRQLMENYEDIIKTISLYGQAMPAGQLNFFGDSEYSINNISIKPLEEYDSQTLLEMEKEASGFYFSGNPLDKYEYIRVYFKTLSISEIKNLRNKEKVKILCIVKSLRTHIDKSGKKMCFIKAEDESGEVEATAFSDVYRESSSKLSENAVILIYGHISERNGKFGIICEKISDVFGDTEKLISEMDLCIKMESENYIEKFESIKKILCRYSGNSRVFIYLTDIRKKYKTPLNIKPDANLLKDLELYIKLSEIGLITR